MEVEEFGEWMVVARRQRRQPRQWEWGSESKNGNNHGGSRFNVLSSFEEGNACNKELPAGSFKFGQNIQSEGLVADTTGFKNQELNSGGIEKINDVPATGVDGGYLGSKQRNPKLNGQASLKLGVRKVDIGRGGHVSAGLTFNVGKK